MMGLGHFEGGRVRSLIITCLSVGLAVGLIFFFMFALVQEPTGFSDALFLTCLGLGLVTGLVFALLLRLSLKQVLRQQLAMR